MSGKNCNVYISLIIIMLSVPSFAQHQISVAPAIGLYVYNSENSLKVMGDKNYLFNYGFELSYKNKNIFGYNIQVDYSYLYSKIGEVLKFIRTGEGGPEPIGVSYSDVSLSLNTIDISVNGDLGSFFSFGFGPSFSLVNKSIIFDYANFVDRLASFNIGINGLINMRIPLSKNAEYWYFYSGLKIRYLHGLFYDEGLRDLENYNQNFVTAILTIGIGYSF
ncbi:MAG: hypothetical protein OQJ93_14230 [Ignavibacteriaceae bacterium]|nr:hypothetical protein [Ignavibacteriaceae bacterium]